MIEYREEPECNTCKGKEDIQVCISTDCSNSCAEYSIKSGGLGMLKEKKKDKYKEYLKEIGE
jgi:hypothetical protein